MAIQVQCDDTQRKRYCSVSHVDVLGITAVSIPLDKLLSAHFSADDEAPRKNPSPLLVKVTPRSVSTTPRSRASAGTDGPRELMKAPRNPEQTRSASEGNNSPPLPTALVTTLFALIIMYNFLFKLAQRYPCESRPCDPVVTHDDSIQI